MSGVSAITLQRLQTAAVTGSCFGVLILQAFQYSIATTQKARLPTVLQAVQLFLASMLCLSLIVQTTTPGISCKWFGHLSFILFPIWVTVFEYLLLLRSRLFTAKQNWLNGIVFVLWAGRWACELYTNSSIQSFSNPEDFCFFLADFQLSFYNLAFRIGTEIAIMIPFLLKMYECHRTENETNTVWFRLSITNSVAMTLLILTEIVVNIIVTMPVFIPYLPIIFALCNITEANLVLFVIEDVERGIKDSIVKQQRRQFGLTNFEKTRKSAEGGEKHDEAPQSTKLLF
jgi:hypothetical protein